jgi:hypothetical protein
MQSSLPSLVIQIIRSLINIFHGRRVIERHVIIINLAKDIAPEFFFDRHLIDTQAQTIRMSACSCKHACENERHKCWTRFHMLATQIFHKKSPAG